MERGFALADDCAAIIIEQVYDAKEKAWVADEIVEYSSVEKAIKALDNYDKNTAWNFDGDIIITFEDGLATSVLLTDTVDEDQPKNPGADEDGIRLNSLGIKDNKVTVNVTNLSSTDVITATGSTVEIKITSESGTQLFYADGVALNTATDGTGGLAVSETKNLEFDYKGSQAASGDYTVTVTIENENDSWSATAVLHLA